MHSMHIVHTQVVGREGGKMELEQGRTHVRSHSHSQGVSTACRGASRASTGPRVDGGRCSRRRDDGVLVEEEAKRCLW